MKQKILGALCLISCFTLKIQAQNIGNATNSLNQAASELKSTWGAAVNLAMAISALVALIGLVMCLVKWYQGDGQTAMAAGKWMGGGIFFLVGIAIIKGLFGF